MNRKWQCYLELFSINFFLSAFTFGGGYIVVPMMKKYFVLQRKELTEEELIEIAAIAQSAPGAIAVNLSVLVGQKIAGLKGAVISCIGAVLPPLLLLSLVSHYYDQFRSNLFISILLKGMEAGVAALMADFVLDSIQSIQREKSLFLTALIPISFLSSFLLHFPILWIILCCSILCVVVSVCSKKEGKRN